MDTTRTVQTGRLLTFSTSFRDLVEQLRDGETLWGKYYYFWHADCLVSTTERLPLRSPADYEAFTARRGTDPCEISFWALTPELDVLALQDEKFDPCQFTEETWRLQTQPRPRKPQADDQSPTPPLWVRLVYWAAGYNYRG